MTKILLGITEKKNEEAEGSGETHFYRFKPARLLHLVIDDRLVLVDAFVSSSREDHVLGKQMTKTHRLVTWVLWQSDKIMMAWLRAAGQNISTHAACGKLTRAYY